jgi:predicted transcriptional regulator
MEIESLFSSTRWEILKILSSVNLSPIELALKMKTTSANISQQLRLLELAGLVKSEKTSNTDKGKPRVVYSLVGNTSFIILTLPSFAEKRQLPLTEYNTFLLKTLFIENTEYHHVLIELYFKLKSLLSNIRLIAFNQKDYSVQIVADNQKTIDGLKKLDLDLNPDLKKVRVVISNTIDFKKKSPESLKSMILLHDPTRILTKEVGKSE